MEGVISMSHEKQNKEKSPDLPMVVDIISGRNMITSYIEKKTYYSWRTNVKQHLLSPIHLDEMKKLPF